MVFHFMKQVQFFSDEDAIIFDDINHSFLDDRFLIIGKSYRKNILFVCFCIREKDVIRIISARKAEKKERENYYAHFKSI